MMPIKRNNVTVMGSGARTLVMAHGFGCDQNMWRFITPCLDQDYRIVLFDYAGCGKADGRYFDAKKYSTLDGFAQDILDVCGALDLRQVDLVGHSVSTMIGLIASLQQPDRFRTMTMVCPSPSFLNLPGYQGGFERADLEELLTMMDQNYIGWAHYLSPVVMGMNNGQDMVAELSGSFCSTDPIIAKTFARATFLSDLRHLLPQAKHPSLILQSAVDALASPWVGEYVHRNLPQSTIEVVQAEGHCLHMTHPAIVANLIRNFLAAHP
jgi:sigma-B regulation protein RsbQ